MCADGGIKNVLEGRHFVVNGIAGIHDRDEVGSVLRGNSSMSEAEVGVKAVMESSRETEKWKIEYRRNKEKWQQFEEIGAHLQCGEGELKYSLFSNTVFGDIDRRQDLAPAGNSMMHQRHCNCSSLFCLCIPMTAAPDGTALHPPVDPAMTRAERQIRRTMGEYRALIGTADWDRSERYVDMEKNLATTPPQVIISTNFIVHSACSFYTVGQMDGEGSERWWEKVERYSIAKL
ncbi:hypothetical protein DFH08DRAFT_808470 [Mycena albidolilacea]|uniref:Uncharacterized protein n=1 Tax=Mycena albidolilacea TaxID=1033008 RepID=A0AAD7A1I9_9AGAR|nr:hypothetical protein DFH08DRAFT_808470 [Mycena albidolilacea]